MESCLAYFSALKMEAICSSEIFDRLNGLISQKTELFTITAVRTHESGIIRARDINRIQSERKLNMS
jgi:hypothetical protein